MEIAENVEVRLQEENWSGREEFQWESCRMTDFLLAVNPYLVLISFWLPFCPRLTTLVKKLQNWLISEYSSILLS